ncbi:MAG: UDP-N-acetylmuramate--L-alanine ligase [Clostridiales bacterium]|nr:UDP-N-acetylmuramate--L-alanine ligase [Clostridiales bacterium]
MKMDEIPRRVHFVGIGGVGMSGLAQHLHNLGYVVTGSDRTESERTVALRKLGIEVHIGHNADNISNAEMVVRTSAVHTDNVEVATAMKQITTVVLREQLLGAIFNSFPTRVAVCGTHGKTTVTAMIHEILKRANVSHTALIGGVYRGNNYYCGSGVVVAEACEFNRSFLNLQPTVCVCLNAEYDHPDCYQDKEDARKAYAEFMRNTSEDGYVVLPYNLRSLCPYRKRVYYDKKAQATNVQLIDGKPSFNLVCDDGTRDTMQLGVLGSHNVNNALAAIAVARLLNIPFSAVKEALCAFEGVDRRWTERNVSGLGRVVVDYAHHPTEIACSVATARSITNGKVVCVFQPHTYSRTYAFFDEFATCFQDADLVAYLPIYSAREKPLAGVNSYLLAERARELNVNAVFCSDFEAAKHWIRGVVTADDVLLILGAGDVCELADML